MATGRMAELTVALSLATDLGTGQPMEHGLRTCWLALAAADALGVNSAERSTIYYVALLRFLGCTSDAAETSQLAGGDELHFNATMAPALNAPKGAGMWFLLRHLGADLPLARRLGRLAAALTDLDGERRSFTSHCEVAARLATRMDMPSAVCDALAHAYERWDGKGYPDGLAGDDVPLAVRVVAVARDAEMLGRYLGWAGARDVLAARRDKTLDPRVVDAVIEVAERSLAEVADDDPCAAVLEAEPEPPLMLAADSIDGALAAIADFADLQSPFFRQHSSGVAALARGAADAIRLAADDGEALRRAALVHDVGKVGVPNGVWSRPGPLTTEQWERVRLHPYYTERVLDRCSLLSAQAEIAARHHERADGSGYHRGDAGERLALPVRVLAAADAYHAMTEERPHRPAMDAAAAAAALQDEADAGRFGRREVEAVLAAAGQATRLPQVDRPAGLTEREVDVLRLIARGQANKQVAATLGISPKTVGRHIEHIYAKAGVSTRAGAALFAMENGLLTG